MAFDVQHMTVWLGDLLADNRQLELLKVPSAGKGGGVTILEAEVWSSSSITNSLGVGGTCPTVALHRFSSGTAPTVNGTVAATLGGTALGWQANAPRAFTIDADYAFIAAGERLVLQYNEINAGNFSAATVAITYINGRAG